MTTGGLILQCWMCLISWSDDLLSLYCKCLFFNLPHKGTPLWADLSSLHQRVMTIPWAVGGRSGSVSISLCGLPCGKWCSILMVRTIFHLVLILLYLLFAHYKMNNVIFKEVLDTDLLSLARYYGLYHIFQAFSAWFVQVVMLSQMVQTTPKIFLLWLFPPFQADWKLD